MLRQKIVLQMKSLLSAENCQQIDMLSEGNICFCPE